MMITILIQWSISQFWDKCMWLHGSFCCCTAIAHHECHFLHVMKHLMMLTWMAATTILPVIQYVLSADFQVPVWQPDAMSSDIIPSVHCAGLLDFQGASQNILLADIVGSPANWRSFIQWSPDQWVSQCYAIEWYRSFFLMCSVLCLYGSCERYNLEQSFHLWLLCENRPIQIVQKKISP
jgi:hypothetical protein